MKKIAAYKTTDGKVFEDGDDARRHQARLDMETWYSEHTLYGDCDGSRVEFEDLRDWLEANRDMVLRLLGTGGA